MLDAHVFQRRRQQLGQNLDDNSLTILFSGRAPHQSADAYYHFHINRNFYYLTGIQRENAALVLVKTDGKITSTVFIEAVDPVEEKWTGIRLRPDEALAISGADEAKTIDGLNAWLGRALLDDEIHIIYLDLEQLAWAQPTTISHHMAEQLRLRYPGLRQQNVYPLITKMRWQKDEQEVKAIRDAIGITKNGIEAMLTHAQPNMQEYELEAHFNHALTRHGAKVPAFHTIIAGGQRATILHYVENNRQIDDGSLVLCDLGAAWSNYSADITRTFPINGKFSPRQRDLYNIVLESMHETIDAIKPGVTSAELKDVTTASLVRNLQRIQLISTKDEIDEYFYHGVSHPLGLDTHDVGARHWTYQPGSVLTVEPGLYIAKEGIGIRIEDDILVTDTGYENLSKDIIKEPDDIEALMASANR